MRYGTNKEKNIKYRGGVKMTGKGEPWHTKEEEDTDVETDADLERHIIDHGRTIKTR